MESPADKLFAPTTAGAFQLANRIVMAPLTRSRADDVTGEVSDLHVTYYSQRAGAGLIITEASQISPEGKGYIKTPGIHTEAQARAWRRVTDAVHAKGGKIVIQLWHVGRVSHVSIQPGGQPPVAPTAIPAGVKTFTPHGFEETSIPRELEAMELPRIVHDYQHAARLADKAGFDGIELHAANGYLIDQFTKDGSNHRHDAWGGSVENRARFLFDVLDGLTEVMDPSRIGIRLSPFSSSNNAVDNDPLTTFSYVVGKLNEYGLAYLHMVEGTTGGARQGEFDTLRALWQGPYMGNNGYDRDLAVERVNDGVDMVAFGRPFIANPDLVERLRINAELARPDPDTMYGGDAHGYIDYPTLEKADDKV